MTSLVINLPDDAPASAVRELGEALRVAETYARAAAACEPVREHYEASARYSWWKVATALHETARAAEAAAGTEAEPAQAALHPDDAPTTTPIFNALTLERLISAPSAPACRPYPGDRRWQ